MEPGARRVRRSRRSCVARGSPREDCRTAVDDEAFRLTRVFDIHPRWGLYVAGSRGGVFRSQLVVYPPGTTETQSRRIRVWRAFAVWGAPVWVLCLVALHRVESLTVASLAMTSTLVAVAGVTMWLRARSMGAVKSAVVFTTSECGDTGAVVARAHLDGLARSLLEADGRLAAGRMSVVDHELIWHRVYDAI